MMKEISLKYVATPHDKSTRNYNNNSRLVPNLKTEALYTEIITRVENKKRVFIKFPDDHIKRPGAIARIHKVSGDKFTSRSYQNAYNEAETIYEDEYSDLCFYLKWDDRKNVAKVRIGRFTSYGDDLTYLPDYNGETVWSMFDPDEFVKDNAMKVYDRMGRELSVNDTVIYINARYGSGACIDFGVVRELKTKVHNGYNGRLVNIEVVIETIALKEGERVETSRIKQPESSIIRMSDVDLQDEAFVRKLTITQAR